MRRVLLQLAVAGGVLISTVGPLTAAGVARGLEHVTFIGDSVASAVRDVPSAHARLAQGIDLDLEVAPCRRLEQESCPPRPPTVIELIKQLGSSIGPVVVLSVGYNDPEDLYAAELGDVLDAFAAANVKRVFLLTLRAVPTSPASTRSWCGSSTPRTRWARASCCCDFAARCCSRPSPSRSSS